MSIVLIISGIICIGYDVTLIFLNPGTLWDIVFSFTHIWAVLGMYLIFLGIYRIRTGHSFWSSLRKKTQIMLICILSAGIAISVINLVFILRPEVMSAKDRAENVILLGGGIDKNGKLPESVIKRVEKAADYLNANPEAVCVVTGGILKWLPYAEAPELKNQLVKRGVTPERILVEDKAIDTIQNFQLSCRMLADYKNVSVQEILNTPTIVVTSRFHLRRSERLAHRMGFTNIKGIPAACPPVYILHNYVREICAYIKLNMRIFFTGKPGQIK